MPKTIIGTLLFFCKRRRGSTVPNGNGTQRRTITDTPELISYEPCARQTLLTFAGKSSHNALISRDFSVLRLRRLDYPRSEPDVTCSNRKSPIELQFWQLDPQNRQLAMTSASDSHSSYLDLTVLVTIVRLAGGNLKMESAGIPDPSAVIRVSGREMPELFLLYSTCQLQCTTLAY